MKLHEDIENMYELMEQLKKRKAEIENVAQIKSIATHLLVLEKVVYTEKDVAKVIKNPIRKRMTTNTLKQCEADLQILWQMYENLVEEIQAKAP